MNLSSNTPKLQVYFFSDNHLYANMIRWGTGSVFNHVGIGYYDWSLQRYIIWESLAKGFQRNDYSMNYVQKHVRSISTLPIKARTENIKKIKKYENKSYSWKNIFVIALDLLLDLPMALIPGSSKSLICSEAVSRILNDLGYLTDLPNRLGKTYDYITPNDLHIALKEKEKNALRNIKL